MVNFDVNHAETCFSVSMVVQIVEVDMKMSQLGHVIRLALPRSIRTELYVLISELAETNEKAVRWKIIFGESIRENGKIVADSFNAAELQDDHD